MFDVNEVGRKDNLPWPVWNIKPTRRVPVVLESAKGDDYAAHPPEGARWSLTP